VINFDFPQTAHAYIHRIGRTARAGARGTSISFVTPTHVPLLTKLVQKKAQQITPYSFKMELIAGFKYRVGDLLRSVTRSQIKEARTREVRNQIINSDRLRSHFDDNPTDLVLLNTHSSTHHISRPLSHLKQLPVYLIPGQGENKTPAPLTSGNNTSDFTNSKREKTFRKNSRNNRMKRDPLKTFSVKNNKRKASDFEPDHKDDGVSMRKTSKPGKAKYVKIKKHRK